MTSNPVPLPADPRVGVIDRFTDRHGFLSNFHPSPIEFGGVVYPTVEHAFQALKTVDQERRRWIATAATPSEAKRRGRAVQLRSDWEQVKSTVMLVLLRLKFDDPSLSLLLLATGNATLIEGNHWGDRTWGATWEGGRWVGRNLLGELLMTIRDEIREVHEEAAADRLRFSVAGGGSIRVGHGEGCVLLEVNSPDGARAAVVLPSSVGARVGAALREQAGHAADETFTSRGVDLTDELVERLASEAEQGYDVGRLRPRHGHGHDSPVSAEEEGGEGFAGGSPSR